MSINPRTEYERRLALRRAAVAALERRDRRFGNARLAVFVGGLGLLGLAVGTDAVPPWVVVLPLGVFAALVLAHDRVVRRLEQGRERVTFYEHGLARLDDRWQGFGVTDTGQVAEDHPHAADLDLFGQGSLFQLLCTARTRAGEDTLARWLTAPPPDLGEVRQRQEAVAALRDRPDLREDLAVLGGSVRSELRPDTITRWAGLPARLSDRTMAAVHVVAAVVGPVALVSLVWTLYEFFTMSRPGRTAPTVFAAGLPVVLVISAVVGRRLTDVVGPVGQALRELQVLRGLLLRLEREPLSDGRLAALSAVLGAGGEAASRSIARLDRLVTWLEARHNALFAPVGGLLLWGVHLGMAVERWRLRVGPRLGPWMEALGEVEALCALAGYAYEHPEDPFPELVEGPEPLLVAEGLCHPLIARGACVRNDVSLGIPGQMLVISGSNMSGKSTFLRSVGLSVVMGLCGGPVVARSLRLSRLQVGASIRIMDSLQHGASRFYQEITRIKQLMDLATAGRDRSGGAPPLLFLIDEVLHGTNSHDRRIGATAIVRQLVDRGALGLLTTHDLALADTTEALGQAARNVHFADHLEAGELVFDYTLRPGVVQRSNAIELMRAVGLDV